MDKFYRLLIIQFLIQCYGFCSYAQIDSLAFYLKNTENQTQLEDLLVTRDFQMDKVDSNLVFRTLSTYKDFAKTRDNKLLKAKYNAYLGSYFFRQAKFDSAKVYYRYAIDLSKKSIPSKTLAKSYGGIGNIVGQQGDYSLKMAYLDSSLIVAQNLKNATELWTGLLYDKANVLMKTNRKSDAVRAYRFLLDTLEGTSFYRVKSSVHNALGGYYANNREKNSHYVDSAISHIKESVKYALETKDLRLQAHSYSNLGTVLSLRKNFDIKEVDNNMNRALNLFDSIDERLGKTNVLIQMAVVKGQQKKHRKAIELLKQAKVIANENKFVDVKTYILGHLHEQYNHLGMYKLALENHKLLTTLKDSINNVQVQDKIAELEAKFQVNEKNKQIALLEKDKLIKSQKQKNLTRSLVLISLLIAVTFLAVVGYFKFNQKISKERISRLGADLQIKELQEVNLKLELNQKSKMLVSNYISLEEKRAFTDELLNILENSPSNQLETQLKKVKNKLASAYTNEKQLYQFQQFFNEVEPDFIGKIQKINQGLTQREIRLLTFLKMGLDNKEIANLLHVQPKTVKMSKYRLKKKLFADSELPLEKLVNDLA